MNRRTVVTAAAAMAVLWSLAAAPATAQDSTVSREGRYRVWYTSPELRAELDFHWADRHLGDEWLVLKLSVSSGGGGVTPISRDGVSVLTPRGYALPLPTQTEFREALGSITMALKQENAWGPPASRFVGSLSRAENWFFSPPGAFIDRDTIYPSAFQYCTGPLVFRVPGGVQPGEWALVIELEEARVRIPFVLDGTR